MRAARAALCGGLAGLAGITLAALAVRQELLAPWWLYAVFIPLAALAAILGPPLRATGRHRA